MEVLRVEVCAVDSNLVVVRPPGRNSPGSVVQGDSLRLLCDLAGRVAVWFRDEGPTDDPGVLGDVQALNELLVGRLLHYQRVLRAHGLDLPYATPATEADLVRLFSDDP